MRIFTSLFSSSSRYDSHGVPMNGGCRVHGHSQENLAATTSGGAMGSPLVGARLFSSGQHLAGGHSSTSVVLADGGVPGRSAAKFVSMPGSAPSSRRYLGRQQRQQQQQQQQQQQKQRQFKQHRQGSGGSFAGCYSHHGAHTLCPEVSKALSGVMLIAEQKKRMEESTKVRRRGWREALFLVLSAAS